MSRIVSAAPMAIMLGTEDLSTRQVTAVAEEIPQHLPKVYIFAKKGPTTPQLVVGDSRSTMYGEDSFDLRSAYATHTTVLSNIINSKGNAQMIERLMPSDAKPPASIRLSLDVLETLVPEYERNLDGSYCIGWDGNKVPADAFVAGFKVKWVVEKVGILSGDGDGGDGVDQEAESDFGKAPIKTGNQINASTNTQSRRIPIMDLEAPYFGADGNNHGIRLWAPTSKDNTTIDPTILEDVQSMVYPLRMSCVYRATPTSTPKFTPTQYAEKYVDVCFKPGIINKRVDKQVYVEDVFIQAYQDLENESYPPMFGPFGKIHLYQDNIHSLVSQFYDAEKPYMDSFSDFKDVVGEEYRFNFISGMTSGAVPYHTFIINNSDTDSVRMTENTTIYAQGGSDGTMNLDELNERVREAVGEYANPLSHLQDTARYPESIVWDSGFSLQTKYSLLSMIAIRKDTAVILSTFDAGGPSLTASEDSSLAVALRTRAQMYPESDYFGTPVMRTVIVGRDGKMQNSQYTGRLPLTLEIATKTADYMGAGNGKWKSGKNFDHGDAARVELFHDISATFTPASVRNKDWDAGLNWVQSYGRRSNFFPALKTVYDNDTSVLNSFFTMMACVELQKVGERAWRQFSGVSSLTNAQLKERVEDFVNENVIGRFDERFVIIPEVYFTDADLQRGYSWSLRIKLYAPNMKTVMTLSVQANRLDDLAAV